MTARVRTLIRRLRQEEDGSLLITALIFVTVMGLVVGAMAELASLNMRNTVNTRDQREDVYTANSAVNAAIEAFRQNPDPTVCDPAAPAMNNINASDITVTCIPTTATGTTTSGTNQPPLAVIALTPDTSEPGFFADSGGQPYVVGGMYSNNTVSMTGSSTLTVQGPLVARNGCITGGSSSIVSDPAVTQCNIGTAAYANGADPLYPAAVSAVPTYRAVPSCPASGPVTMQPGTYTDGQALTALFSSCAGRVFHFPASSGSVGVYYFDFTNAGSHQWTINNPATTVVGGTFRTGVSTANAGTIPVGQRCNAQADGVQFIFGGDSRINVQAGSVELCAQHDYTGTNQQIAVYGLDNRHPVSGTTSSPTYNAATASATSGTTNPDNARLIDNNVATAPVNGTTTSRTITLNNFNMSSIPAGSQIHSVALSIRHHESVATGQIGIAGTLTGTGASFSPALTRTTTPLTQPFSATSAFTTRESLQNLSFGYTVTKSGGGPSATFTGFLDGVDVVVSYTPPTLRRQSGCVATGPYSVSSSTTCAFITTSGAQTSLSLEGTLYAPLAAVDVQLTNVSAQVFGRGIIARVIRAQLTASSTCIPPTCSPFRLPTPSTTAGPTDVVFLATVEGNKRLRALVRYPAGGGAATVMSWSSMNES